MITWTTRKPTIAALPGPAAGAGLALALACDIRIAAESAIMATGYVRIGLTGDYGIAWLLTRLVGTSRARELMFLSERIDARRCETLGLVNRVVPDSELPETAFALARSLADGPSIALAWRRSVSIEAQAGGPGPPPAAFRRTRRSHQALRQRGLVPLLEGTAPPGPPAPPLCGLSGQRVTELVMAYTLPSK